MSVHIHLHDAAPEGTQWITLEGGQHVVIDSKTGEVKGGAGGKLNGKKYASANSVPLEQLKKESPEEPVPLEKPKTNVPEKKRSEYSPEVEDLFYRAENNDMQAREELKALGIVDWWRRSHERRVTRREEALGLPKGSADRVLAGFVESLPSSPYSDVKATTKGLAFTVGGNGVTLRRNIIRSKAKGLVVEHSEFRLSKERQGNGTAKKVLASSIRLYEELGVDRIELNANIDVGGYAWARYGFTPATKKEWRGLADALMLRLSKLTVSDADSVKALLSSDNPKAIRAVAALREPVSDPLSGGAMVPLGKALLLGMNWQGSLNMKDKESLNILKEYIK